MFPPDSQKGRAMVFRIIRSLLLLVTSTLLTFSFPFAFADESAQEPAEADANLAASQEAIAMRYRRFEGALQQLSEYLRKTDPARAELLVRAIGKSKEGRVADQFQNLTDLLKKDQLGDAIEQQETLVTELKGLLELLMSEARRDEIEFEKKRLQNLIRDVTKLIGQESDARAETERGGKNAELTEKQQKIANSTKNLVDRVEKHDASKKAGKNDPKSGDKKEGDSKDQSKDPKDSDDQQSPDDQSDSDKQSDEKPDAEKKSGNQPSKKSSQKEGKQSGGQQNDDKQKSVDPQDEQKKPSDKDSKDEKDLKETDPSGKTPDSDSQQQKSPEGKDPSSKQKQQGKQKDGKHGKSQQGKPQKGQSPQDQEQEQQPDQNSENQDQQDSNSQEDEDPRNSPDKTPGREEIKRAMREMNRAIEELKKKNNKGASDKQDRAIAQLLKAKEKLEEILLQKREEERELVLAQLETRFRDMLVKQEVIFNSTVAINAVPADDRTDRHRTQSVNLARDESEIAMLADKALLLLKEEGSSIAFPEAVEQIRDDMQTIARRLERVDVGEITQNIERDTIESLKEVIEAMQREIEKLKDKKQQNQSPGEQKQQQQELVKKIAEMKMLRSLQYRVNRRTKQLGRLVDGEQAIDPDVLNQLKQLSDRQAKVQKATYDLATGKNQ